MSSPHLIPDWWQSMSAWNFWGDYDAGRWEPGTHQWIEEYVKPGTTYVDVGAWIGPTVLWAAPLAGRVIALEPDPVAGDMLVQNVVEFANVELVRAALAEETGSGQLCPAGRGFGSAMSRLLGAGVPDSCTWDTGGATEVATITLPDLFDRYAIDNVSLLKMDIEGGESEVLESVCPFLAERGIPFIVSMHPGWHNHTVERAWFDCFTEVIGDLDETAPVLALP